MFFLSVAFAGAGLAQEVIVVEADRMIDPRFDTPIEKAVVVIRGVLIVQAGASGDVRRPAGAEVIDLSGYTILPGLMDCHVHISGRPGDGGDTHKLRESVAHEAIYGVAHAKITLEAGLRSGTSVRATTPMRHSETLLMMEWFPGHVCGLPPVGSGQRVGMPTSTGGPKSNTVRHQGYSEALRRRALRDEGGRGL